MIISFSGKVPVQMTKLGGRLIELTAALEPSGSQAVSIEYKQCYESTHCEFRISGLNVGDRIMIGHIMGHWEYFDKKLSPGYIWAAACRAEDSSIPGEEPILIVTASIIGVRMYCDKCKTNAKMFYSGRKAPGWGESKKVICSFCDAEHELPEIKSN